MSLISVIVPVYNVEKYLSKCLESILSQSFLDIEVICVNDGSTDRSAAILKEYAGKDSRITVINQSNCGLAAARNAGLRGAAGRYVLFVDSDDWIHPEICATLAATIFDDLDLVVFDVKCIREDGLGANRPLEKYLRINFRGKISIDADKIMKIPVVAWNKMYRKDVIDKYQISFPEGLLHEDNSFHWKYLVRAKSAYFVPQKLYNYRIRHGSITDKIASKVLDHFRICLEIHEYLAKYDLLEKYWKTFEEFFLHCLGIVCRHTDDLPHALRVAQGTWSKIGMRGDGDVIRALENGDHAYVAKWINYSPCEKVFSIKNRYGQKVFTICGRQFYP
ncbi:MAG: glycosyltransferase [Holosporaceae bacterium]|nr:glycosyltransferase [Holosporaceae bacterium]